MGKLLAQISQGTIRCHAAWRQLNLQKFSVIHCLPGELIVTHLLYLCPAG
jgi:hypothetical protein